MTPKAVTNRSPFTKVGTDQPLPIGQSLQLPESPSFGELPSAPATVGIGRAVVNKAIDVYQWVETDRAKELICEDFLGNGVLRFFSDSARGILFGTGHLNLILGRERITREAESILTDNVSAGVMAFGLGMIVDRALGTLTNSNIHLDTLNVVRHEVAHASGFNDVLTGVRGRIAACHPAETAQALDPLLTPQRLAELVNPTKKHELITQAVQTLTADVAHALGLPDFKLAVQHTVKEGATETAYTVQHHLPQFLEDLALLHHGLSNRQWAEVPKVLADTHHWKLARMGLLTLSLGLTMAAPHFDKWVTHKLNGIDYYPGDEGLANAPKTRLYQQGYSGNGLNQTALQQPHPIRRATMIEHFFPFVSEQWQQGNPLPAMGAALPLVLASGLFNTGARRFIVPFFKAFEGRLPVWGQAAAKAIATEGEAALPQQGRVWIEGKPGKQWAKQWAASLDYERGFPWTTQQQMAMLFAGLITMRIGSARSANEYRERCVDSTMGWGLWILGSPLIRPVLGKHLFKAEQFELFRPDQTLRTGDELAVFAKEALAKKGITVEQAKRQLSALQATAFGLNVLLLGIAEPFVSMMTTLAFNRRGAQPPPPDVSGLMNQPYLAPPSVVNGGIPTVKPSQANLFG